MSKKISTWVLVIVLLVLVGIYLVVRYARSSDRTFREKVLSFDPADVTQVIVKDPDKPYILDFQRANGEWRIDLDGKLYKADSTVLDNVLVQLQRLKTKYYAGNTEEIWKKYELTDSTAMQITLRTDDGSSETLMVGHYNYIPPRQMGNQKTDPEATSYVRVSNENEVYTVEGFLKMNFNREPNAYRDKRLIMISRPKINRIVLDYPDQKIVAEIQDDKKWLVNGMAGDSLKMLKYTSVLSRLSSVNFLDTVDVSGLEPAYSLVVEGEGVIPVTIKAYPVADTNISYIMTSTLNPESFFNGKAQKLFDRVMIGEQDLLPDKTGE